MRFQVRVGEQYSELLAHLESLKPELRGKRLLALAAMQLARSEGSAPLKGHVAESSIAAETCADVTDGVAPVAPAKRAPDWITRTANGPA